MEDEFIVCQKCGDQNAETNNYCKKCASPLKNTIETPQQTQVKFESPKKKNKGCLIIFLWIVFLPIMAIITIAKSKKISKPLKVLFISIISVFCIICIAANSINEKNKAETTFNDIKIVVNNKDYVNAQKQLKQFLIDYPSFERKNEATSLLNSINDKAEKMKAKQKAEADKIAAEKKAAAEREAKKEEEQKNIKVIIDSTTLSQKEAEKVFSILKKVGFKTITECRPGAGTNVNESKGFAATCDGMTVILTIEKRKVYYVGVGSIDLYDSTKGGVLNNINNFTLTDSERISFMIKAEDYVKQGLKSPSTAEFPSTVWSSDKWSVGRYKNIVQVSSYVDSQNGFGAMIRSDFIVEINYSNNSCTYLSIGGETVYGKPYKK